MFLAKFLRKQAFIRGTSGFTLLELILSLTVLGVVLLIIFGALRIGTRAWEKGEKDTAIQQRQRAVLGLLSQQIASACIFKIKTEDGAFYFRGSEESMEYVSRAPIVPGALTGMVFVKYEILDAEENGKKQLKLYEKDAGFLKEEDLEGQKGEDFLTLITGIDDLRFEYLKWDEDGTNWRTNWQPSKKEAMPLAIRIAMKQNETATPITIIVPIRCQKE